MEMEIYIVFFKLIYTGFAATSSLFDVFLILTLNICML